MSAENQLLQLRRLATSNALRLPLPFEIRDPENNLAGIEQYLREGYGVAGFLPHFSYGDFLRVLEGLITSSSEIRTRPILIPIAQHQKDQTGLQGLRKAADIQLQPIVTQDTIRKEQQLLSAGKGIPWEQHEVGWGNREYIARAAEVLGNNGVVLVAPQAGRRPKLEPFESPTVGFLDIATRRARLPLVAYFFMGLEVPGEDYGNGGFNPFKKYAISIGEPMTREDLHARAKEKGRTIDQEAYQQMYQLAPPAYLPE